MPGLGHLPELLAIMVIALIFFGPSKLPEVGNTIGKGIREFRRASSELRDALTSDTGARDEEDYGPVRTTSEESEVPPLAAFDRLSTRQVRRRQAGR